MAERPCSSDSSVAEMLHRTLSAVSWALISERRLHKGRLQKGIYSLTRRVALAESRHRYKSHFYRPLFSRQLLGRRLNFLLGESVTPLGISRVWSPGCIKYVTSFSSFFLRGKCFPFPFSSSFNVVVVFSYVELYFLRIYVPTSSAKNYSRSF